MDKSEKSTYIKLSSDGKPRGDLSQGAPFCNHSREVSSKLLGLTQIISLRASISFACGLSKKNLALLSSREIIILSSVARAASIKQISLKRAARC
jgi:hypothetical protein